MAQILLASWIVLVFASLKLSSSRILFDDQVRLEKKNRTERTLSVGFIGGFSPLCSYCYKVLLIACQLVDSGTNFASTICT